MVVGDGKSEGGTSLLQRSELLETYQKHIVNVDPSRRDQGYNYIEPYVVTFLSEMEHQRKLSRQLLDILDASVKEIQGWSPQRGHDAFKRLERYAQHMLDAPWKNEFKTMKIFSGFFKVYIEPHLRKAEDIFYMIGYEVQKDSAGRVLDTLVLQKPINRRTLAFIASECYFAAIECVVMSQIIEKTGNRYRIQDVYKSRVSCTGGVITCVRWLTENCSPLSVNGRQSDEENEWTRSIENKRHSRSLDDLLGRKPTQIPELRRGDSEDTKTTRSLNKNVRDWAESNLSNLYNGDENEPNVVKQKTHLEGPSRDSGYGGSHYIGEPDHIIPSQLDVLQSEDLYAASKANPAVNNLEQVEEFDMFKARTADDHVQRSLKFIEKMDSHPARTRPQSSPACSDDWSHIRESLRQEYGDRYFEGDRGCILKQTGSRKSMPIDLHSDIMDSNSAVANSVVKQPPTVLPKPKGKPRTAASEPPLRDAKHAHELLRETLPTKEPLHTKVPASEPVQLSEGKRTEPLYEPIHVTEGVAEQKDVEPSGEIRDPVRAYGAPTEVYEVQESESCKVKDQVTLSTSSQKEPLRVTVSAQTGVTKSQSGMIEPVRNNPNQSVASKQTLVTSQSATTKPFPVSSQSIITKQLPQNQSGMTEHGRSPQSSYAGIANATYAGKIEPIRVTSTYTGPTASNYTGASNYTAITSANYAGKTESIRVSPSYTSKTPSACYTVDPKASHIYVSKGEARMALSHSGASASYSGTPAIYTGVPSNYTAASNYASKSEVRASYVDPSRGQTYEPVLVAGYICPIHGVSLRASPTHMQPMHVHPTHVHPSHIQSQLQQHAAQVNQHSQNQYQTYPRVKAKPDLLDQELPPPPLPNDIMGRVCPGPGSDSDSDGFGEMGSKTIPPCRRHQSHDPFIENCNRNTNTIMRARPNSALLEDQFKSILLAKEDRASSYYNTPTFSTFGKQEDEENEEEWPAPPAELLSELKPESLSEKVESKAEMEKASHWQCEACTFANQPGNSVCEMCARSRVKDKAVTFDGPVCPHCTYANLPGAKLCAVCSKDLHSSIA